MATLTKDVNILHKEPADVQIIPVVAADIIYKGGLLMVNAAGFAAPATPTASTQFAGVAQYQVDNSTGAAGDKTVTVYRTGRHLLTTSSATQANVGDKAFASDDGAVVLSGAATNSQKVGIVAEFVSATQVWVDIAPGTQSPELAP